MANEFGQFLKKAREARNLSQGQVGLAAGVSTAYVSQLESGVRKNVTSFRVWEGLRFAFKWNQTQLAQAKAIMERGLDA
jgi:predicted transcriptional regulator